MAHFAALRSAWDWWRDGLLAALPTRSRARGSLRGVAWAGEVIGDAVVITAIDRRGGTPEAVRVAIGPAATSDASDIREEGEYAEARPLALSVPESSLLRKDVALPLAAEEAVRDAIGYEIDRLTPFPIEQVHFGYRIIERNEQAKRLIVRIVVVPKREIDPVLSSLHRAGFIVRYLTSEDGGGLVRIPMDDRTKLTDPQAMRRLASPAVTAALIAAVLYAPLFQEEQLLRQCRSEVSALKEKARTVAQQEQARARRLAAQDEIATYLNQRPRILELLKVLNSRFPEDTWLDQLEIQGKAITLYGEGRNVSDLAGALDQRSHFRDVAFRVLPAAVGEAGVQRFEINATLSMP